MKRPTKRWKMWAVPLAIACVLSWIALRIQSNRAKDFRGDGAITDNGLLGFPRYRVSFRKVPLDKPGVYHFGFRGVPREAFTFRLEVSFKGAFAGASVASALRSLGTKLSVELLDRKGTAIVSISGALRDASEPGPGGWIFEESSSEGAFYQLKWDFIPLRTDENYVLVLTVKDVDPRSPHVLAEPVLETMRSDK